MGIAVLLALVAAFVYALTFWGVGVGQGLLVAGLMIVLAALGLAAYLWVSGAGRAESHASYYAATGKLAVLLCLLAAGFGAAVTGVGGFLAWRARGRRGGDPHEAAVTQGAPDRAVRPLDLARLMALPDRTAAFEASALRAGRGEPDAVSAFAEGAPGPFRLEIAYRHAVVLPDGTRRGEHHHFFCDPRQGVRCIRVDTRRMFQLERGEAATEEEAAFAERL